MESLHAFWAKAIEDTLTYLSLAERGDWNVPELRFFDQACVSNIDLIRSMQDELIGRPEFRTVLILRHMVASGHPSVRNGSVARNRHPSTEDTVSMRRIPELDALRGLAAIAIVLFHYSRQNLYFLNASLDLFFVLSGYLITSIILAQGDRPGFLGTFYLRRGLRIWPIYYLAVVGFALVIARYPRLGDLSALPWFLTYTQNVPAYWGGEVRTLAGSLDPTWSLAVEEQFYLLWPGLVLVAGLGGRRAVVAAMAAVAVGSVALRCGGMSPRLLLARADGFALGGLLAAMLGPGGFGRRAAGIVCKAALAVGAGALAVGLPMMGSRPFEYGDRPAEPAAIAASCVLFFGLIGLTVLGSGSRAAAPLRSRTLRTLGKLSYGIYLYHMAAYTFVEAVLRRAGVGVGRLLPVAAACLTLAMAAASWRWVEAPILALKDRFGYRGAGETSGIPDVSPGGGPAPGLRPGAGLAVR